MNDPLAITLKIGLKDNQLFNSTNLSRHSTINNRVREEDIRPAGSENFKIDHRMPVDKQCRIEIFKTEKDNMKKSLNYSNYTLGGINIIKGTPLKGDPHYQEFVSNNIIHYQ
jgi:hypothetical protein